MPATWLPARHELLHVNQTEGAWRVATRAALSVVCPLLVLVSIHRPELAPYACFGAFSSLYGRNVAYFTRLQMQLSAGLTLTMAVVIGVLVAMAPDQHVVQVLVAGLITAGGQVFARAHKFHPPGPLFMIFAYGAISSMPHTWQDVPRGALVCALSALFSVLIGISGLSLKPGDIRAAWAETGLLRLEFVHNWQPAWMALSVMVAGAIAHLSGIGHPYWAMVAALAPLSAPHVTSQVARGVHRAIGTLLGLLPSWALLLLPVGRTGIVVMVAVLQLLTELVVGRNYAIALLVITPMALLMGELGGRHPVGRLLYDRGAETIIGCVVAILVALAGHVIRQRRLARAAA